MHTSDVCSDAVLRTRGSDAEVALEMVPLAFHAEPYFFGRALAPSIMSISPPVGHPDSTTVQNAGH